MGVNALPTTFDLAIWRGDSPGNRMNNELLFINLAAVTGLTFFKYRHIQAVDVGRNLTTILKTNFVI